MDKRTLKAIMASAITLLALASCGRKAEVRPATTIIKGEFPAGALCDTVMIGMNDGVDMDTVYTIPVFDEKFTFEIPTDVMKRAEVVVTYDEGMGNAFFIPEGDTVFVSLDTRNAAVKCVSSRNPSITNDYNRMISTLDSLKWSLFREFKATEPAEGYTKEQNDSLDFILTTKMNDTILEQIHRMAPLHTGDFIGLSCIYNLMSMGLDKEAKSLFQTMDESIRNREELSRLNL